MSDVARELHRLADLLRMVADTARLIAKRSPDIDPTEIQGAAAEIGALAEKIERLATNVPDN